MRPAADVLDRVVELVSAKLDRRPVMVHVRAAVEELVARFSTPLLVVETGTIRSFDEEHESTRHIGEALADRGRLVSIDLSPEAIEVSRQLCRHLDNVEWVLSDSTTYLAGLGGPVHFALLDSANDSGLIFEEFRRIAPKMAQGGIVMVDDAGLRSPFRGVTYRTGAVKGHRVARFLESVGADYRVLRTPRGHGTQLRIDLAEDNAARVGRGLAGI